LVGFFINAVKIIRGEEEEEVRYSECLGGVKPYQPTGS